MKYFGYIRKSSKEKNRQIQSIPKQYQWIKKEAKRRGITIERYYEDSRSGHTLGRKGFEKMVEDIEVSQTPIGIITWKISRLSRNPVDEGIIKYAFMREKIGHIIARDREYKEGENQIIMGVDFGQATQYSIELSKDVTEGMEKKMEKGYRPTKAPYGYINDPTAQKGEKKIFKDPVYFKPIQNFLKLFATGLYSVSELRKIMTHQWGVTNRFGRPFSTSTLYLILKRRFYCGEYLWNGVVKKGKHPPMISLEEHLQIQQLISGKNTFSENKYENYYSGQITCKCCQSTITGYSKVKHNRFKGISTYHYLKCSKFKDKSCDQKNISRSQIDHQIIALLEKLYISDAVVTHILKLFEDCNRQVSQSNTIEKAQFKKQLHTLESELETLTRKLTKGIVSDAVYKTMQQKIQNEITLTKSALKNVENPNDFQKIKQFFTFLTTAKEKFLKGSYRDKKYILKTLGSNFWLDHGKLVVELHAPFELLAQSRLQSNLKKTSVELQKNRSSKGLSGFLQGSSTRWSSYWEKLRTSILIKSFRL